MEFRRVLFFFSSRRRHTRYWRDWSSDVCSSDLVQVQMLLDGVRPTRELGRHQFAPCTQPEGHHTSVLRPELPADEALRLQRSDGVAHRGLGEAELPGKLADPAELDVMMEQVDEELGPYRAQAILLRPLTKQDPEGLAEPLERGDDLGVHAPVL